MAAMVSTIRLNGPNDSIVDILQGKERIVSYPGTSQFNGRGISACGLAAMNFARVLSDLVHVHSQDNMIDLLRAVTSKEVIQVSVLSNLAPVKSSGSPLPLTIAHETSYRRTLSPSARGGQVNCTWTWKKSSRFPYSRSL